MLSSPMHLARYGMSSSASHGDKQIVIAEQLGAVFELGPVFEQPPQDVDHERRPAGGSFDEADAQAGKFFGDPIRDEIAEGEDRQRAPMGESVVARVLEVRQHPRRAGAGVDADRHVELGGLLVNRMKIGMIDGLVAFDAAEEYAHGADSLARCISLSDSGIERKRQHRDELQPAIGFVASRAKPRVVGFAQRRIQFRIVGDVD